MALVRSCDYCGMARQRMVNLIPVSSVFRYSLSRQIKRPDGRQRKGRFNSVAYTKAGGFGAVDMCDPCWDKFARNTGRSRPADRCCDVCGFARKKMVDGKVVTDVIRYTMTRRDHKGHKSAGGTNLCPECWERIAKPRMRPELRGKTGPVQYRGRVTRPEAVPA